MSDTENDLMLCKSCGAMMYWDEVGVCEDCALRLAVADPKGLQGIIKPEETRE